MAGGRAGFLFLGFRRFGQAVSVGEEHQLDPIGNLQFSEYRSQVVSDGRRAYEEAVGNIFALEAFSDQDDHFSFPAGEGPYSFVIGIGF